LILQSFVRAKTQLLQSFIFLPAKKTSVSAQPKSNQKEGAPGLPPLRGILCCSYAQAAAELALCAQTVLAEIS
jgi:hypothetical protein